MAEGGRRRSSSTVSSEKKDADFENELRIVLIGKTGNGKSSTGNCILGKDSFGISPGMGSLTRRCDCDFVHRFGKTIHVVDTPGLYDTELTQREILTEIVNIFVMVSPGPHAFILVLKVNNRFTDEEENAVKQLVDKFGETIYDFLIVIFTGKDQLEQWSENKFIKTAPNSIRKILRKCSNRYLLFNNHGRVDEKEKQAKRLVDMIIENTRGVHYTNEDFEKAEKIIKMKEEARRQKEEERTKREKKEIQRKIQQEIHRAKLENDKINEAKIQRLEEEIRKLQDSLQNRNAIREVIRKEPNDTNLVDVLINTLALVPRFLGFGGGKGGGCVIS